MGLPAHETTTALSRFCGKDLLTMSSSDDPGPGIPTRHSTGARQQLGKKYSYWYLIYSTYLPYCSTPASPKRYLVFSRYLKVGIAFPFEVRKVEPYTLSPLHSMLFRRAFSFGLSSSSSSPSPPVYCYKGGNSPRM